VYEAIVECSPYFDNALDPGLYRTQIPARIPPEKPRQKRGWGSAMIFQRVLQNGRNFTQWKCTSSEN
jgi:hypothetical protein